MSGVLGIYGIARPNIMEELFYGLCALQHRGEEGCGIAIASAAGLLVKKAREPIYYFLKDELPFLEAIRPQAGIGHALYEGSSDLQPTRSYRGPWGVSLAMDGVLLGVPAPQERYVEGLLLDGLEATGSMEEASRQTLAALDGHGSCSLVALVQRDGATVLLALRDPRGIKPLCLGEKEGCWLVASESKGLDGAEAELVRDIRPGELLLIGDTGVSSLTLREAPHQHCAFEWVYFADPTSAIEGRNVYLVRKALGRMLADAYPLDVDLVICSPDSGRGVALGYAQARGLPFEEAVVKNPGAKRTFQVEDPEERGRAARAKFFINRDVISGRRVVLGDDSIVRGTVVREGMIAKLRRAGAREVHLLISCPALCYPCFKDPASRAYAAYGFQSLAAAEVGRRVAQKLGAESVCYPSVAMLEEAIGHEGLCRACMDGVYPVAAELLGGSGVRQAHPTPSQPKGGEKE
jgi:amidophosphoribosyltransferase